jgi:hypothetical protein
MWMVLDVDPEQAPHLARPQADQRQSVGSVRWQSTRSAPKSKAKSRTSPNSVCSSASTTMSTAWSTCPTSTGTSGDEAIEDYNKGDVVKAKVLDVDVEKERISLGIKQLGGDPMDEPAA